jgi:hypothetical protein
LIVSELISLLQKFDSNMEVKTGGLSLWGGTILYPIEASRIRLVPAVFSGDGELMVDESRYIHNGKVYRVKGDRDRGEPVFVLRVG